MAPLLLVSFASASQYTTTETCNFTFSLGDLPNFRLPEAGPNSPGDVQLNAGNGIITEGWLEGDSEYYDSLHSCNGESSSYYVGDDTWNTTYISNDGDELEVDVFYAANPNELWVRHLQPHMDPSLYEALNDTTIRLNVTCGVDSSNGCIEFTANFTDAAPYNYTKPYEFADDCSHGFSSGEQLLSVRVHAASPVGPTTSASLSAGNTLILAGKADQGLPWSEGFHANGTRKGDEFWGEWWATIDAQYNADSGDGSTTSTTIGGIAVCCMWICDLEMSCPFTSAYHFSTACMPPHGRPTGYSYVGCYYDSNAAGRIMSFKTKRSYMTTELCSQLCADSRQFGTQFTTECWCGPKGEDADYAANGAASNCDMECGGDENDICGGANAMSVYEFSNSGIEANALEENEESGCTGTSAQFWNRATGEWSSTFETIDGESHDIDMFYLNLVDGYNELWVTEIESWMAPSLYVQLQYNYVKLNVTCPAGNTVVDSCVMFEPTFTNWSPDIVGSEAGYRFSDPAVPSFDLPEAAPNSPGDVLLTAGNGVVTRTGATTETSCNGDSAEYYGEDGFWYNQFIKTDGESHELTHVFYPTSRNLYAATIQENWEPNLRGLLENRTVRIRVWCTNDERAEYLFFRVSGEESTCDDIDDLCTA
ncbi:unnamed protein product, partial [Pylaiella littoralis]